LLDELRGFIVGQLRHHHEREDHALWPMLVEASPDLERPLARLSHEHDDLEAALVALETDATGDDRHDFAARAHALHQLVVVHLEHEEPVLLPALRSSIDDAAWSRFSREVVATAPVDGIHLMIGFLDRTGPPEAVTLTLRHLPAEASNALPALRRRGDDALQRLTEGEVRDARH
jgi:hypothetical protein